MTVALATKADARASILPRKGEMRVHDTHISVWEDDVDEPAMRLVMRGVLGRMRSRGFKVERDPHTAKNYPSLSDRTWYGRKGDLEMVVETSGRTMKVEFFQNVANVSNPNGGRHDYGRFARMPRTMSLQCIVEMAAVLRKLHEYGYTAPEHVELGSLQSLRRVVEGSLDRDGSPLERFNRQWSANRFERDETGWPTEKEYARCNNDDRDKKQLRNGMVRYFRSRGRLLRGTIFTNINSMWQVVDATGACLDYVAGFELFECDRPDIEPRRLILGRRARIESELQKAMTAQKYRRVASLAGVLDRLSEVRPYFVRDTQKGSWWCEDGKGYTASLARAGRFTEERARGLARSEHTEAIHCEEAAARW